MSAIPVILGVDLGWKKLGLAACSLEAGRPLLARTVSISEDHGGWMHQQVSRALSEFVLPEWEVCIVAIEDPTFASRGKTQARQWGEVMAHVESSARRLWPHVITGEDWRLPIATWKASIGTGGQAPVYVPHVISMGWPVPIGKSGHEVDAAAAAGVASAAYRINAKAFE